MRTTQVVLFTNDSMSMFPPIRIAEELILLMLDERSGYLDMVPNWDFSCTIAGAVLADLALENRIDTDLEQLILVDPSPTGDTLLDTILQEIAASEEASDTQFWIERNASRSDDIVMTALDRLVDRNILDYEPGGFWGLSRSVMRSGTYPTSDLKTRKEAKARVLNVILNDTIPDPRDAILIALMHTAGGFKKMLEHEDYEERLEWIETITKLELIGRTVAGAVKNSAIAPRTRRFLQTKPIPRLRITEILRQRDFFTGNIAKAMCGIYQTHGPVVKIPMKMGKAKAVALIGPGINRWVNKHGRFYLRSKDYIEKFEQAFGASKTLPGLDGAEHHKMRKALRHVYSRTALADRLPEMIDLCRRSLGQWKKGDVFGATEMFQNHISSQVSHLSIGVDCSHYVDELLKYQHRALTVHVQGAMPKFMLSTPKMRRYRQRVVELKEAISASHTPAQRKGKTMDIPDAILALHKNDPMFMPETDMTFPFVASMVASIYLGSALSFAIFCLVNHPDVYERVHREASLLFSNGRLPEAKDFNLASIDVAHRACLEAQRLYPVIPWQLRTVMNQCTVSGFEIPVHTRLLICQTAPHYMEDLFENPSAFDIDRYLPDRAEHTVPGAYAPYGLGTHTCLGNRWVELQMAVNLLLIVYHLKLEMASEKYKLRINPFPTCAPDKKLKLRVAEVTNPV